MCLRKRAEEKASQASVRGGAGSKSSVLKRSRGVIRQTGLGDASFRVREFIANHDARAGITRLKYWR